MAILQRVIVNLSEPFIKMEFDNGVSEWVDVYSRVSDEKGLIQRGIGLGANTTVVEGITPAIRSTLLSTIDPNPSDEVQFNQDLIKDLQAMQPNQTQITITKQASVKVRL